MSKLSAVSYTEVTDFQKSVDADVAKASTLEQAAQKLVESFYNKFKESSVLVRCYATVPYSLLPGFNKKFVDGLAQKTGIADKVTDNTQVLSLLGSYGKELEWKDRTKSMGHVGIPLVSSKFVGEIPMIARMLQQMGTGLEWLDASDLGIVQKTANMLSGMFFVPEASQELDSRGRKVIPAQDFVKKYDVKTVFGTGGGYITGTIVILVVFSNESLDEQRVRMFGSLINILKGKTVNIVVGKKFFN